MHLSPLDNMAGIADQLWYLTGVLSLCPFVASLGARRPGSGAWLFFVVLPLILVLEWPAISLLMTSEPNEPLLLQTPAVIGILLVLIMGAGNYVGTRFTVPVLLFAIGEVAIVLSVSELHPHSLTTQTLRYAACFGFGLSGLFSILALRGCKTDETGFSRVWSDFRDCFGIVWCRRVAERFNLMAKREKLELRIDATGPHRSTTSETGDSDLQLREEQILRWILKRFVDPEWLDQRFGTNQASVINAERNDTT